MEIDIENEKKRKQKKRKEGDKRYCMHLQCAVNSLYSVPDLNSLL